MKNSIKTYIDSIVSDNKQYIIESNMTVAEYIILNADNNDTRYVEFFDEKEYEHNDGFEPTEDQINEFKSWINENYNFYIEEE